MKAYIINRTDSAATAIVCTTKMWTQIHPQPRNVKISAVRKKLTKEEPMLGRVALAALEKKHAPYSDFKKLSYPT